MAALTELTGGTQSSAASATTASISPTANRPVYAVVLSAIGGGTPPTAVTVSGAGLTWAVVDDESAVEVPFGTCRLSVWRGVNASPSAGTLSLTFGGETQNGGIAWTILDGEGLSTTVQVVTATGTGTTAGVTLSTFANGSNFTLLAVGNAYVGVNIDHDAPLTDYTQRVVGEVILRCGSDDAQDLTPSATLAGSHSWAAIGLEISLAAPAGPTITTQPTAQTAYTGGDNVVEFPVVATTSGGTLVYDWELETSVGGGVYANLANGSGVTWTGQTAATATATCTATTLSGRRVRCNVSDDNGTVTTNAVALTILEGPIVDPTSGSTDGSGVETTSLTSDVAARILITAYDGATVVGRVTTLPA